jgi:hypothetical protein
MFKKLASVISILVLGLVAGIPALAQVSNATLNQNSELGTFGR